MVDVPLLTYVATMSVTPGPNNLMLAASGVNFGFRRSVPHILGVSVGHGIQVFLIGLALAWMMQWLSAFRWPLVIAGCLYLLWLAWRQAHAGQPGMNPKARPLGFIGAVLFQWINPKAWMMVINTVILFLPRNGGWQAGVVLMLWCAAINLPCIAVWALAGDRLRMWLRRPVFARLFNGAMALLLAATALWILLDRSLAGAGGVTLSG